ncbi:cyclophilin-like fold protein [Candidatus Avelusimicrobium alvi]|uniref:cyclophilin-like fold protein n=1 Tax=Candidatus Avelusimicrobium alvi TaxID=3416221 RepID=UPI003D0F1CB0
MQSTKTKSAAWALLASAGVMLISFYALSAKDMTNQPNKTTVKIKITVPRRTVSATLNDSRAAREFLALLPLTLELTDFGQTEKIADLPQKLSTKGAPAGFTPQKGDLAYYAPWGNLAIFRRDFRYSENLIKLGRIETGLEALDFPGHIKAVFEREEN